MLNEMYVLAHCFVDNQNHWLLLVDLRSIKSREGQTRLGIIHFVLARSLTGIDEDFLREHCVLAFY